MVQVDKAPFSRDRWTHAVFTLENINDKSQFQAARLYLDGKSQGVICRWDMTFGWPADAARLILGAAYVGRIDDLAVFHRPLTDRVVLYLYQSPKGAAELR
jgi:hypothetical protein